MMASWWDSDYNPLNIPGQIWSDNFGAGAKRRKQQTSAPKKSGVGVTVGTPGLTARGFEEKQKQQSIVDQILGKFGDTGTDGLDTADEAASYGGFNPAMLSGLFGSSDDNKTSASERLAAQKAARATETARGILGMINSGSYKEPYTQMNATLAKYLEDAQNAIKGAYGGATTAVQQAYATDPFAGMTGTDVAASSGLEGLLSSQGASTDPLAQLIAANREASSQRAGAVTDLAKVLSKSFAAQGQQAQSDIGTMQAGSLADLLGVGGAYGQEIQSQEAAALKALQTALSEAAGQGADLGSLVKRKTGKKSSKGKKG